MELRLGDVSLISLTKDKIELVRNWRNDPAVNRYLQNREAISPKQQEAWFEKIEASDDLYFIIQIRGIDVGIIYTKQRKASNQEIETNVLIGNKDFYESGSGLKACLLLTDHLFRKNPNCTLFSMVNKKNSGALDIDQYLGFVVYEQDDEYIYSKLDQASYESSQGHLLLKKLEKKSLG